MKSLRAESVLKFLWNYLMFFLTSAFAVTCCVSLFASKLSEALGVDWNAENLNLAAKSTFLNVLLLSAVFTLIDALRRRITVSAPLKKITAAADRIVAGDFSARVDISSDPFTDGSLRTVGERFNTMAKELESVETLRLDFISNVSHEMKTPLAVLQNYAALLQAPNLDEPTRIEYAAAVANASRRAAETVSNILQLNRLENQNIFPNKTPFDLSEQLREILLEYEPTWEAAEIELETDLPDALFLHADRDLLRPVWNNLLSNAFKFTPKGGTVTVSLTENEESVTVRIADTGCGMSPQVGERIFEKFYQADESHTARGNGLGLALVKRAIDLIGGEISVQSAVGKGSTFTVTIRKE